MNSETGRISSVLEIEGLSATERVKYIPVDEKEMTSKQKRSRQVSLRDNRSPLGKLRFKTFNNLRNKPCPLCNSGKKFKKCCWNQSGLT